MSEGRQAGRTTEQMQQAPRDAVFVWCKCDLYYPRELARRLGRHDLQIMPSSYFQSRGNVLSCRRHVVVDHAFWGLRARWQSSELSELLGQLHARGLWVR